ncbi:MAG: hypothetical protein GX335_10045 [Firmicutes bacterium]|nr:hypothetical protein [Bacillota bacterium]
MVLLLVVGYLSLAAAELVLWTERPFKKVFTYLFFMALALALSVLIAVNRDLPVPSPLDALRVLGDRLRKD